MEHLSEATAIRLYNSVVATGQSTGGSNATTLVPVPMPGTAGSRSTDSVRSVNEFGNSCRICRWNRSDMQISRCPCHCKGSVGFIHLPCLKRWILHRRDNRCEICNVPFDLPDEKMNIGRMLRTFMCARCFGAILKHLVSGASLLPLAHIILQQVLICMENINMSPGDTLTVPEVLLASCALLTSSALFFHYFEFITTRFFLIRNILRQWWIFGNSPDFAFVDLETDSFDLF